MQQQRIILFIVILFLTSSVWLFNVGNKFNDPDYQKDWWAVYFVDPKGDNLDFVIENHSDKKYFHWEVLADKDKIKEGDVKIEKGAQAEVSSVQTNSGKITVRVSAGEGEKEIYKFYR